MYKRYFNVRFKEFIEEILNLQTIDLIVDLCNDFGCEDEYWQSMKHDLDENEIKAYALSNIIKMKWNWETFFDTFIFSFYGLNLDDKEYDKSFVENYLNSSLTINEKIHEIHQYLSKIGD